MSKSVILDQARKQGALNRYFEGHASYWNDIYSREGVKDFVHQERLRVVLELVDKLDMPIGTRLLDVGCGAGFAAAALGKNNYLVDAVDPVPAMVRTTFDRTRELRLEHKVRSTVGDVYALPFRDNTFGIVIAMGVLPWLPSIDQPLREIRRVLQPTGYAILTSDNIWSFRWLLEPLTSPLSKPGKEFIKRLLRRFGYHGSDVWWYPTSRSRFDAILQATALEKLNGITLGFGPFSCFHRELLPPRLGLTVHRTLQMLADRGIPVLRGSGSHYIVLAKKGAEPAPLGVGERSTNPNSQMNLLQAVRPTSTCA